MTGPDTNSDDMKREAEGSAAVPALLSFHRTTDSLAGNSLVLQSSQSFSRPLQQGRDADRSATASAVCTGARQAWPLLTA
jgi:hypothetical protein